MLKKTLLNLNFIILYFFIIKNINIKINKKKLFCFFIHLQMISIQ